MILKVTETTVRREIERNRLICFKVGTDIRISENALLDYMNIKANKGMTLKEAQLEKELLNTKKENERLKNIMDKIKGNILEAL